MIYPKNCPDCGADLTKYCKVFIKHEVEEGHIDSNGEYQTDEDYSDDPEYDYCCSECNKPIIA